jgi:hypothetical protein
MQARIVNTVSGARWLAEGWRLFRTAPVKWFSVVFLYFLFTNVFVLLPLIGIAATLLVPVFTVGLYAVARALTRGHPPEVRLLFSGFQSPLRPQLVLGAAYAASMLAMVAAIRLVDSEGILQSVLTGERGKESIEAADVLLPIACFALLYTPIAMFFWFAAPLVAWHSTGVMKALFFSFVACLMNWRAFMAYVATVVAVIGAFLIGVLPIASIFGLSHETATTAIAVIPFVFILFLATLIPTLCASYYASYRDIFAVEP